MESEFTIKEYRDHVWRIIKAPSMFAAHALDGTLDFPSALIYLGEMGVMTCILWMFAFTMYLSVRHPGSIATIICWICTPLYIVGVLGWILKMTPMSER